VGALVLGRLGYRHAFPRKKPKSSMNREREKKGGTEQELRKGSRQGVANYSSTRKKSARVLLAGREESNPYKEFPQGKEVQEELKLWQGGHPLSFGE